MSLVDALLRSRDPVDERALSPQQIAWARGDFPENFYSPAGVNVDRDSMLGVSAVWACVSLIGDSIATLPLCAYKQGSDGVPAPADVPDWLSAPNPEQTLVDFKFSTMASLLLHGNAYCYTVRDKKLNILEAWLLDPRWVYVRREYQPDGSLALNYYVMVAKGLQSPVGPFKVTAGPDMFHIMAFQPSSSWPMGIGPLDVARMMFGGAIAGQEMATRFFSQGFNAAGVIEHPDDLQLDQAKQLKEDFKAANAGGPRKMHLPPVLTGGAQYKQIQITAEQSQFLQQRQFGVDEIARWFRVPPHMIGNLEKTSSWGAGIEEQSIGFVKYTLRPWLERLEESWTRHFLTFQPGVRFRFDTKALERGNMANQADYFLKLHGVGGMTANQIAAELGYPPFEGGDEHYFMVNTAPVGTEPISINKTKVELPDTEMSPDALPTTANIAAAKATGEDAPAGADDDSEGKKT